MPFTVGDTRMSSARDFATPPPNRYQSLGLLSTRLRAKLREIGRPPPRGMLHQDEVTDIPFDATFTTRDLAAAFMQRRKLAVTEFTPAELGDPKILVMAMSYLLAFGEKHL